MKTRLFLTIAAMACSLGALAQEQQDTLTVSEGMQGLMKDYFVEKLVPQADTLRMDTVSLLYEQYIGVLDYLNDPSTPPRPIYLDPDYYRLFLPFTYYSSAIDRVSELTFPERLKRPIGERNPDVSSAWTSPRSRRRSASTVRWIRPCSLPTSTYLSVSASRRMR